MTTTYKPLPRILAVDPTTRGFGFVILDAPDALLDWGIWYARGDKNASCLRGTQDLIRHYGADILTIEDTRHPDSLRRARVRRLFPEFQKLATRVRATCVPLPWKIVREVFGGDHMNKEEIAAAVAARFPELAPHLPPHRKAWRPEDPRMSMFDAAALAVACLATKEVRDAVA